ncbi:MAG TPA: cytochrome c oxidase assembly protein [Opitutaceae bacterium]|nr:cytochrome c oxidase assembly protein [Opitutaceae bacterium]
MPLPSMIDWHNWLNEPILVAGIAFVGVLWAVLAGPCRQRLAQRANVGPVPFPTAAAVKFYASLLILYVAVGTPLNQIAEAYLLSVHMFQHLLVIYPAAILFLLGLPYWMTDPVLAHPAVNGLARFFTRPVVCALVFLIVFGLWHAPWLFNAALDNELIHIVEHVMFFGAAALYWWPLYSRSRILPPRGYATQMLYLLAVVIGMMPIHAYITFSNDIIYPTYATAPRLFPKFTPADDQLLAGVAMQMAIIIMSMIAFTVAFYHWYQALERRHPANVGDRHRRRPTGTGAS